MPRVSFFPDEKIVEVQVGENLLRAAMVAEVYINAPCAGEGTCGRCKVIVNKGEVETRATDKLTPEEKKEGYVLACLASVKSDLEVSIPLETRLGRPPELREKTPRAGRLLTALDWRNIWSDLQIDPRFKKFFLELPPPTLDDHLADLQRLNRELKRKHNLQVTQIDFEVLKSLSNILREADWKVTATILAEDNTAKITQVELGDATQEHYAVAIDVGTTTVVAELIDLGRGEPVARTSAYNSQVSCGADVISRMVYSAKPDGLRTLQELVIKTVDGLVEGLVKKAGIKPHLISHAVAAGNTIMLHFLFGLDPRHIREAPYIPVSTKFPWVKAKELGVKSIPYAYLSGYPCVASYVGGDVVAGVLASKMSEKDRLSLFIDIGTNGEIVLGNSDWLISAATSAGPAFEGGGVKFGMRAARGAIESVRIDSDTKEPIILTIGGAKPLGICGSGLVDTLAELFLSGIIDQKGKLNLDLKTPRLRKGTDGPEYVLAWAEDVATQKDIAITQVDLDNLIRAKAAIFAGIKLLSENTGVSLADIEEVYIAGAFGNYLEVEKVMTIGLLPEIPPEKFIFVGNGSLLGAYLATISSDVAKEAQDLAEKMTYLELSMDHNFMNEYISALFLPHTHMEMFPSVVEGLKTRSK